MNVILINVNILLIDLDADGFPDLLPNHILIETYDGSTFGGIVEYVGVAGIPLWMKPGKTAITHQFYYVYIETPNTFIHYATHAPLDPKNVGNGHNPADHFPIFADVLMGTKKYLTSKPFEIFDPNNPLPNSEPHIRIYITVPEGPIFSAVLKTRPSPKKKNFFWFWS